MRHGNILRNILKVLLVVALVLGAGLLIYGLGRVEDPSLQPAFDAAQAQADGHRAGITLVLDVLLCAVT